MNTHDRIELPPLPYPYTTPAYKTVKAVIQEYTRAAIKADRQQRGEPAAWQPIETAPKDGTLILAAFSQIPQPTVAMWNAPNGEWVAAVATVDTYHGECNDTSFENEYFADSDLKVWAEVPHG